MLRLASRLRFTRAPRCRSALLCSNSAARTPYELLDLPVAATPAEIKLAFFRKARVVHPDVNPDPAAAEEFQRLEAAYRLLGDSERRRAYDENPSSAEPADQDPRWKRYPDPEFARERWQRLTSDRAILREMMAGEAAEFESDLRELGGCIARGDMRGVATFVKHQPLMTAAVVGPVVLTRMPQLSLALLRLVPPHLGFWALVTSPFWFVPQGIAQMLGYDLCDIAWRSLVRRAKMRNQRRANVRISEGGRTEPGESGDTK